MEPQIGDYITKDLISFYRYGSGEKIAKVPDKWLHSWFDVVNRDMDKKRLWVNIWYDHPEKGWLLIDEFDGTIDGEEVNPI